VVVVAFVVGSAAVVLEIWMIGSQLGGPGIANAWITPGNIVLARNKRRDQRFVSGLCSSNAGISRIRADREPNIIEDCMYAYAISTPCLCCLYRMRALDLLKLLLRGGTTK
jgi:hypothetical protein